jgi:hypothetical protein
MIAARIMAHMRKPRIDACRLAVNFVVAHVGSTLSLQNVAQVLPPCYHRVNPSLTTSWSSGSISVP